MASAADKILKRLVQSHFRGSQPRISNIRPTKGCDFAIQVRVIRARSLGQFLAFTSALESRYPQAQTIVTFQGTVSPTVEIVFQIHAAVNTGA